MTTPLFQRILDELGEPQLIDELSTRISTSQLQTLLLELFRRKAASVTPSALLRQYERDRTVGPATVPGRTLYELEALLHRSTPADWTWIELSPVICLGASSVVGPVSQDKVLSTIRSTEVVSDVTNALALECAVRRRGLRGEVETRDQPVRLMASHRMLRTQRTGIPGRDAHFRVVGLCTAGRSQASHRFVWEHLGEHLRLHVAWVERAVVERGLGRPQIVVSINLYDSALTQHQAHVELGEPLRGAYPSIHRVSIRPDSTKDAHYHQLASFQVSARLGAGRHVPLANGGLVDWTQQLLSDRKERLLTSGLFVEQLARLLEPPAAGGGGGETMGDAHDAVIPERIEIDGNDGTGKSTLVAALARYGIEASDRGRMTKATDEPSLGPEPGVCYVLLDASIACSQERLLAAGKDLEEKYHREEDLVFYRQRFLEVAVSFGAATVDARTPVQTLQATLAVLVGRPLRIGLGPQDERAVVERLRAVGFEPASSSSEPIWSSAGLELRVIAPGQLGAMVRAGEVDLVLARPGGVPPAGVSLRRLDSGLPNPEPEPVAEPGLVVGWSTDAAAQRPDVRAVCDALWGRRDAGR